jgi:ATP-binding cassette subfamily C (CFTR/MRP) protein 4
MIEVLKQEHKKVIKKSVWDFLTFSYLNPLLRKGMNQKELLTDDYLPLEPQDDAEMLSSLLLLELEKNGNNLGRALFQVFKFSFFLTGIYFLFDLLLKISEALILAKLINWFSSSSADWEAYSYCAALTVTVGSHAILRHRQFFSVMRMGLQVKVAVTTAVYRKILKLSVAHTSSTGRITNLIVNDVQKFEDAAIWLHFVWYDLPDLLMLRSAPIELLLTWYFIYSFIGLASLAPLLTLIFLFPLQLVSILHR